MSNEVGTAETIVITRVLDPKSKPRPDDEM